MTNNTITDRTYGVKQQERLVLEYLSDRNPDFAEHKDSFNLVDFTTYPWYNGREKGIVITMSPEFGSSDKYLHIAIFEHRNSDELCCLKWETKRPYWNHPLEDEDIFQTAYKGKGKFDTDASFPYMSIRECGEWVYEEFASFYKANHKYQPQGEVVK